MKKLYCSYYLQQPLSFFPFWIAFLFSVLAFVSLGAQPINDDCAGVIDLGEGYVCPAPEVYNNIDATPSSIFSNPGDNVPLCFQGGNVFRDVWFAFHVPADGSIVDYEIIVSGVDGPNGSITNPQFAIYRGDCVEEGLAELACVSADDGATEAAIEINGLTPGITYFIRVDDWNNSAAPNAGDFEICIQEPEADPENPDDLPWDPDPNCGSIVTDGVAAVTCGTIENMPQDERWVFGLMNINDVMPNFGRVDVTNNVEMYHHPSWHIDSIGNVFGITMDDQGNIFVTASSNYGTQFYFDNGIVRYGDIGGGAEDVEAAGTVYKIDGITGQASVFGVLPQQQAPFLQSSCEFVQDVSRNTGPGLGNIAFNQATKQFYVTNFEDGRIYRLDEAGTILDSYDPWNLDNGAPGVVSLFELAYGLSISPDGSALFFGNASTNSNFAEADIYAINLNPDGSFAGTVNNSSMPAGASWDNYEGTETLHYSLSVVGSFAPEQLAVSDMEFLPNGKLLVGFRSFCSNNIHTSYNHGGQAVVLSQGSGGLFSQNEGNIYSGYFGSLGGSRECYGGVSAFTTEDGDLLYVISSADMLIEEGPHGIHLSNEGDFGNPGFPVSPAGVVSYGTQPFSFDPKGIGGDVKMFVACGEEEVACSLEDIDAGEDLTICAPGQTVTLNGSVTGEYIGVEWTPSEGLSDPNILNPEVEVSSTTTFTLKAFGMGTSDNLITNGNFNFGNIGFTSDYVVGTGGPFGALSEEGTYAVTTNTNFVHSNWASCEDNTGGGNMLAVNGSVNPSERIWCQTVTVTPETDYEFSAWITSAILENPPILQFSINDTLLGSPFNVPPAPCQWNQFFQTWSSGMNTSVEICITNQNTIQSGNDFAIDDISFGAVCTLEDEVTVFVAEPLAVVDSTALIPCDNSGTGIVLDGTGSSAGAGITYEWTTIDGNIVSGATSLTPLVDAPGTYTLTVFQNSSFELCTASANVVVSQDTSALDLPDMIELCLGDSFTFDVDGFDNYEWSPDEFISCTDCPNPTVTPISSTTYTLVASNADGCTASASTDIIVLPVFQSQLTFQSCAGDSIEYNGVILAPGSVTDFSFTASNGCDSVVTVMVEELEAYATALTLSACASETVDYNGNALAPGSVTDFTFTAANGCDSVVTVTVEELETYATALTLSACANETVDYNGNALAPGSVTDFTFTAANGCDSVVTVTVEELEEYATVLTLSACASETVDYNGNALAPGSVTDFTFTAANGCDSVVTVTVEELEAYATALTLSACANETVDYNGNALAPGSVTDFTFTAANGCDSVVTVTVEELEAYATALTLSACASETVDYNGNALAPGSVTDFTFTAVNGCDSVVTVTVEELEEYATALTLSACANETVDYNGNALAPGSVTDFTFTAANGCDSVVTVTVEELEEYATALTLSACASETVDYNGNALAPGSVTDFTFTAANGCDSVVTVTVEELEEYATALTLSACASETVDYNGNALAPGSVTDFTFTAVNGCDSVVTVTVEELEEYATALTLSACASETVDYNGNALAPGSVTDFTFTAGNGCDSVVTVTVETLFPVETFEAISICPEDSVDIFGVSTNTPGTYTMVFMAANGCDSTHSITLNWFDSPEITSFQLTDVSCFGGTDGAATVVVTGGTSPYSYLWNTGNTEASISDRSAGTYEVLVTDANGCSVLGNIDIDQPAELVVTVTSQDVGCDEPGLASAAATGGTPPYTFMWSNGSDSTAIIDLLAGNYTVTVTDANDCTGTAEVQITGAFGPEITIQVDAVPTLDSTSNGALSVNITGGTAPFEYEWSTSATTPTISGLTTGEYIVTLTDSNGCSAVDTAYLFLPGCVSGVIWEDENRDGCQTAGELKQKGYNLVLTGTDIWGNPVNESTITDFGGAYLFEPLAPGNYQLELFVVNDWILTTPNNCSNELSDSDFSPATFTYNFNLSDGECLTNIDGGLYDPCLNVLDPGSICCEQTLCGPGNIPDPIVSLSPATGAEGPVEYMWMKGNFMPPSGALIFVGIPNSNSPDYAPGALHETTYFARCVRAVGCKEWLETNIIEIVVEDDAVADISGPNSLCIGESGTFTTPDNGPDAQYFWDFGLLASPSQASQQSVNVSWPQQGYYTITLTVVNEGCTSVDSYGVVVLNDSSPFCPPALEGTDPQLEQVNAIWDNEFTLFPTPASDELNIRWDNTIEGPVIFTLFALDGMKIRETTTDGAALRYRIPIEDIPAGLYLLNIQLSNGETINLKAIKQN